MNPIKLTAAAAVFISGCASQPYYSPEQMAELGNQERLNNLVTDISQGRYQQPAQEQQFQQPTAPQKQVVQVPSSVETCKVEFSADVANIKIIKTVSGRPADHANGLESERGSNRYAKAIDMSDDFEGIRTVEYGTDKKGKEVCAAHTTDGTAVYVYDAKRGANIGKGARKGLSIFDM